MRVLVCGGRAYADRNHVYATLDAIHAKTPITHLIHGGARGADSHGREWAFERNVPMTAFMAEWKHKGKAAGPIRNRRMLETGKPDLVVAFPGGRGTADMCRQARVAGVEVIEA